MEFLERYIDGFGNFPTCKIVAEHFGISRAAVSGRFAALIKKQRLLKVAHLGFLLLNPNGSVYCSKDNYIPGNSCIELVLRTPSDYSKSAQDNLLFVVKNDFFQQCSIRNGDLLEVETRKVRKFKLGDLVVIRCGMFFFAKLYFVSMRSFIRNIALSGELVYNSKCCRCSIVGCVIRIKRKLHWRPFV